MKKVLVFGSFDLIHPGHYYFFKEAKKYGDYLAVVIAKDETIRFVKSQNPLYDEFERKRQLEAVELVDEVFIGSKYDKYAVIKSFKPDVICLGHDQVAFVDGLKSYLDTEGLDVKIVRLKAYMREMYSSSLYKKRLKMGGEMDIDNEIGRVVEYYDKKRIAVIEITDAGISKDDVLIFKNSRGSVESKIISMQINKNDVGMANVSDVVGVQVQQAVNLNDVVIKKNKKMVEKI